MPAAVLVYITYLSSVAETVYVGVLTILNAALGLAFHVAFPLASDIKILLYISINHSYEGGFELPKTTSWIKYCK